MRRFVVPFGVLAALAACAGGAWWYFVVRPNGAAQATTAAPAEVHDGGIVTLPPFTVNLADQDASRFLRVDLRLVVDAEKAAADLEHEPVRMARLRSVILELLTECRSDELVTPEGKQALKTRIAERATTVLHSSKVTDVLFVDFVVQF